MATTQTNTSTDDAKRSGRGNRPTATGNNGDNGRTQQPKTPRPFIDTDDQNIRSLFSAFQAVNQQMNAPLYDRMAGLEGRVDTLAEQVGEVLKQLQKGIRTEESNPSGDTSLTGFLRGILQRVVNGGTMLQAEQNKLQSGLPVSSITLDQVEKLVKDVVQGSLTAFETRLNKVEETVAKHGGELFDEHGNSIVGRHEGHLVELYDLVGYMPGENGQPGTTRIDTLTEGQRVIGEATKRVNTTVYGVAGEGDDPGTPGLVTEVQRLNARVTKIERRSTGNPGAILACGAIFALVVFFIVLLGLNVPLGLGFILVAAAFAAGATLGSFIPAGNNAQNNRQAPPPARPAAAQPVRQTQQQTDTRQMQQPPANS